MAASNAFGVTTLKNGRYMALDERGRFARSFATREEAGRHAEQLRADSDRSQSGGVDPFVAGPSPSYRARASSEAPRFPAPPPGGGGPASPLAFEVAHFGDKSGGYGVFNAKGGIEKTFDTQAAAEKFAELQKRFFDTLGKGLDRFASVPAASIAAVADLLKQRQRDLRLESDAWTAFMIDARNIPKAAPARPFKAF